MSTPDYSTSRRITHEKSRLKETRPADLSPYKNLSVNDLWNQYKSNPTEEMKKYLVEKYLPMVTHQAIMIGKKLPSNADREDLEDVGVFGLIDAIDNFDLERKVKFETYAAPRIRGAILDELRSMDWVPRNVRHRTNIVNNVRQNVKKETGENPTLEEIQERLGVNDETFAKIQRDSRPVNNISLSRRVNTKRDYGSKEVREIDRITSKGEFDPTNELQRKNLKDILTRSLFERAERLIFILYYYENMTMKEIGKVIDLSESRISQMHKKVLIRLKTQLQERGLERQLAEAANDRQFE